MNTTVKSLSDLGSAWNATHDRANRVKLPKEKKEVRKCKKCGEPLRQVAGTNVWMCDYVSLEDAKLPDGTDVQVFTKCGNVVLA